MKEQKLAYYMESLNEKPTKQAQKKKKHDFGGEQYWIIPTKGNITEVNPEAI